MRPSMGGIWCQNCVVQSLNTQPRVRVWSWANGSTNVLGQTHGIRRAELRAFLWRPVRLQDRGVRVLVRCGWLRGCGVSSGRRVLHRAVGSSFLVDGSQSSVWGIRGPQSGGLGSQASEDENLNTQARVRMSWPVHGSPCMAAPISRRCGDPARCLS